MWYNYASVGDGVVSGELLKRRNQVSAVFTYTEEAIRGTPKPYVLNLFDRSN